VSAGTAAGISILLGNPLYVVGEALEFYLEVKRANPRVRVIFLVGRPTYLSLTWPTEVMAIENVPQQWAETVRRFVAAA